MTDTATVDALRARLEAASRRRLGRSLTLRHVPGGGCGGCGIELRALDAVHGLAQYGLRFVDSPRAADVLLLTGPLTRNVRDAVLRVIAATPEPRWVVAIGDCAIDGGVFKGSYAVLGGAAAAVPVDLAIAGCPPTPSQILAGLRALVEANAI